MKRFALLKLLPIGKNREGGNAVMGETLRDGDKITAIAGLQAYCPAQLNEEGFVYIDGILWTVAEFSA